MQNIIKLIAIFILIISLEVLAQNQAPVVTNVTFTERTDGSFIVDVNYDVNDADNDTMTVRMKVSGDAGQTWSFTANNITGDVGAGILSGTGKHIVWDFGTEHPQFYSNQIIIKIEADDGVDTTGCPGMPTVIYAGKTYHTVQIGTQCWLKENLDVGIMITSNSKTDNQANNGTIEKYCYDNDPNNCTSYGGLYQWQEAMQYVATAGAQGICPTGWHIPTYADFVILKSVSNGNMLKAIGQGTGSGTGTNMRGFSALLVGYRYYDLGSFRSLGNETFFWSSTQQSNISARYLRLNAYNSNIDFSSVFVLYGNSVRCLKD